MALTQKETLEIRLGSDLKFPIVNNFEPVSGLDTLLQDIQLLLLTLPGERVNRPDFGCGLRALVWENMITAAKEGPGIIKAALATYEPRIIVTKIEVYPNDNTGLLSFLIGFYIKSTDTNVNLIFPLRTGTDLSFS